MDVKKNRVLCRYKRTGHIIPMEIRIKLVKFNSYRLVVGVEVIVI